jgi:hypothetical protein
VQVIERPGGRYEVRGGEFDEALGQRFPMRIVLKCNCRARLVLEGHRSIRRAELDLLACGVCGEKFVVTLAGDRCGHSATLRDSAAGRPGVVGEPRVVGEGRAYRA